MTNTIIRYTAIYDKFDNKKKFFFLLHFFGSFKVKNLLHVIIIFLSLILGKTTKTSKYILHYNYLHYSRKEKKKNNF